MDAPTQLSVVGGLATVEWQYFRRTGSRIALEQALDRLQDAGWVIGPDDPVPGPFDTWTVLVGRPVRRPLDSTPRAAS